MTTGLLDGRVAIVTGGAGGIGAGISTAMAEHGATVAVVDIDPERAAQVTAELIEAGATALGIVADVLVDGTAESVVAQVVDAFGGVDVLVNNVGHYLGGGRRFHETDEAQWGALHDVNLGHVLRMCQAAIPAMIDRGPGGSIINLTTVEAHRGIPHQAVYGAYKAAVAHFTTCLALDLSGDGIRVNAIAPDVTQSLQLPYDQWLDESDRQRIPRWVPLGRLGQPADCGGAAVFLASELSAFVTGASIPVDGGTGVAGGWYRTEHGRAGWTNRPRDA
jgi:NAD(P)-dependent dehydrogenase (short-subunit alcohol dehydrogenase family)